MLALLANKPLVALILLALAMLPVTANNPPILTLPVTPAPPPTCNAPVDVEVELIATVSITTAFAASVGCLK